MPDLSTYPRFNLAHLPTPFEEWSRLGDELGLKLFAKRDDCTGLAFGGNKTRKLEFLVGDALAQKATCLVTVGAIQSNHCRQTVAAANKAGLPCHLVLVDQVPIKTPPYIHSGNVLLDHLLGAKLHPVENKATAPEFILNLIGELQAAGETPYFMPPGGSTAVGALGYVDCAMELATQAEATGANLRHVVVASSSAGTQAGLVAGFAAMGADVNVHGVNVYEDDPATLSEAVAKLASETLALLKSDARVPDIIVHGDYRGEGYGIPTEGMIEALGLAARLEAVLLDPVYSGKGMAGLIGLARAGAFGAGEGVCFIHTGGTPGLFAYAPVLNAAFKG